MGADLYIEAIHTPVWNRYAPLFDAAVRKRDQSPPDSAAAIAAQAEVNKYYDLMFSAGYFRDSYNATSVLWRLDLSWWTDVIPLCNENHHLTGDGLATFRQLVQQATLTLPTRTELEAEGVTVTDEGEESLAGWHAYFREKHAQLLAFLDEARACHSSIRCSL